MLQQEMLLGKFQKITDKNKHFCKRIDRRMDRDRQKLDKQQERLIKTKVYNYFLNQRWKELQIAKVCIGIYVKVDKHDL